MMEMQNYLIAEVLTSAVILILGRVIFNSIIRRLEVLEKADTVLLEAVSKIQLDIAKEYVSKEDCAAHRKATTSWLEHLEKKVDTCPSTNDR